MHRVVALAAVVRRFLSKRHPITMLEKNSSAQIRSDGQSKRRVTVRSLNNVTPADVYFGRHHEVLSKREKIKRLTLKQRKRENLAVQTAQTIGICIQITLRAAARSPCSNASAKSSSSASVIPRVRPMLRHRATDCSTSPRMARARGPEIRK
jgi:hypothetical protein